MKKMIRHLLVVTAIASSLGVYAQDPHFNQYYTFASQLNPALVGNYNGSYRLAVLYRNQWGAALSKSAYETVGADVDFSFLEGYLRRSKLAVGVGFFNDRSGQAGLSYLNASLSLAYHQGFGKDGNHRLSLGLQGAYVQKRLDNPLFGDQHETDYSVRPVSAEDFTSGIHNWDFNFGLYWKSNFRDRVKFGLGMGAFHLIEPKEKFVRNGLAGNLYRKFSIDFNLEAFFGKKRNISLSPELLVMLQGPAREITPGVFVGYYFQTGFRKNNSIHVGLRYRVNNTIGDAVIPMAMVEFRNVRLGFGYDVNVSSLSNSTKNRGAFEISLSYVGESIKYFKGSKSLPSRRF
ncbi:MAG: PorP/SprF family type IX secretion system membrane protein [Chitinophagales bacterium]